MDTREVLLELSAGVGGQEAMRFTQDLTKMYLEFCTSTMGWTVDVIETSATEIG